MQMQSFSRRYGRLLVVVGALNICTPEQVNACLYSEGSRTTTYQMLSRLWELGYLEQVGYRTGLRGNHNIAYRLATAGYNYLTRVLGVARSELIYPSDNLIQDTTHILHALVSNWPIVWALQLQRKDSALQVSFRSERTLRRADLGLGRIPDSWIRIRRPPTGDAPLWVEWDRGRKDLRPAFATYQSIDQSPDFEAVFGTKGLVIVVVVEKSEDRLERVIRDCEQVVVPYQSDLFRFGRPAKTADEFYFAPRWRIPFNDEVVSLLPSEWRMNNGRAI